MSIPLSKISGSTLAPLLKMVVLVHAKGLSLFSFFPCHIILHSGGSRPSNKDGARSSTPWDKGEEGGGAVLKKFFCQPFGPQFGTN